MCNETVLVKQTAGRSYFRNMLLFSGNKIITVEKEISIKGAEGNHTEAFPGLLKDYHLYL